MESAVNLTAKHGGAYTVEALRNGDRLTYLVSQQPGSATPRDDLHIIQALPGNVPRTWVVYDDTGTIDGGRRVYTSAGVFFDLP